MKILVIEDDLPTLKSIELRLKKKDYEVVTASLGSEGIKKVVTENPDLLLLDMYLPDTTGLDIMKELQKQSLNPVVIVMTGNSTEEIAIQSLRLGAKDYILKPFKINELIRRLNRIFREINLKKEEERIGREKELLLEQLKKVQDMKDRFLDMIVHNLKNPLNSVLGFATVLATRELSSIEKMEYHKIIEEQGQRMLIMLDDLLRDSFYKDGKIPLKYKKNHLRKLLDSIISNIKLKAKEKSINFITEIDENLEIIVDGAKLTEVIENILDNSLKFTPEEGQIKIVIQKNDMGAVIIISDTGIGIPEKFIDKLFLGTPLISRKGLMGERGTGLGLAFCKKIIDIHNGDIKIKSEEFGGTEINIFLPHDPCSIEEPKKTAHMSTAKFSG